MHDAPDGYENLIRIDQGGSAIVYRATDARFDRPVALKILRSDNLNARQRRRFNAECLATGRVSSHPNIVTVYDAGTTRGHRPWLAMEYCSGGSLAHKIALQGPLPVSDVVSIGVRLCSALSAAHEAGILHRDVKPHNVLLTSYGEPALADFGIATVCLGDDTSTETGAYTVVHAAPEILDGEEGTAAADIYSLASTLYTLLAGRAPFAAEASTGLAPLVSRILRNDVPAIPRPGVPPALEELLRRSMAARPQDRPASAAELGASLADLPILPGQPVLPCQPVLPGRHTAGVPSRRVPLGRLAAATAISGRRVLMALAGVLGVLLVMFLAMGLHSGSPGVAPPGAVATRAEGAVDQHTPTELTLAQGHSTGELIVSWRMPSRPLVVATVIYQGSGTARARAIVTYSGEPHDVPQATLSGLPRKQRVCLSAAHVVSAGSTVTSTVSRPVCAVPR